MVYIILKENVLIINFGNRFSLNIFFTVKYMQVENNIQRPQICDLNLLVVNLKPICNWLVMGKRCDWFTTVNPVAKCDVIFNNRSETMFPIAKL